MASTKASTSDSGPCDDGWPTPSFLASKLLDAAVAEGLYVALGILVPGGVLEMEDHGLDPMAGFGAADGFLAVGSATD